MNLALPQRQPDPLALALLAATALHLLLILGVSFNLQHGDPPPPRAGTPPVCARRTGRVFTRRSSLPSRQPSKH